MALQLRLLLSHGTWVTIARVISARGAVVLRRGTVLVVTEARETIGFNPGGPLGQAHPGPGAEALATSEIAVSGLRLAWI